MQLWSKCSIAVELRLVGPMLADTHVGGLLFGQLRQLGVKVGRQVQACHVLVHLPGQQVHFSRLVPERKVDFSVSQAAEIKRLFVVF